MKIIFLFSFFWNNTIEDAVQLKTAFSHGWVWTVIHLLSFILMATIGANMVLNTPGDSELSTRRNIYLAFGFIGISSLFSYHYFLVTDYINGLGLQEKYLQEGILAYMAAWLFLYIVVIRIIYPLLFNKYRFGTFLKSKQ